MPNIGITNQTPIKNLLVGETFTAGDFPIKILEISGALGSFSGKGYVTVPYLNDTKIAVAFENIKINTNYQLIDGVVETAYDASWSNVQDITPLVEGMKELFDKINDLLTQKDNGTISKEEFNQEREALYAEIITLNNAYRERVNYDDFTEETQKEIEKLDTVIKELNNTNFDTKTEDIKKYTETLNETYQKVEDFAKNSTMLDIEKVKQVQQKIKESDYGRVYNAAGKLLATKTGNLIVIKVGKNIYKLSQLDYTKQGTLKAVASIIKTEAEFLKYEGVFGVKTMNEEDTGAHTESPSGTVYVNIKQIIKETYDNVYNLRNMLEHEADTEKGHKEENKDPNYVYKFMDHAKVYLAQSSTNNYNKSTDSNKYAAAYGYANRVINAKIDGDTYDKKPIDIAVWIKKFNDENSGKVTIKYEPYLSSHMIWVYINDKLYNQGGTLWSKIDNPRN